MTFAFKRLYVILETDTHEMVGKSQIHKLL